MIDQDSCRICKIVAETISSNSFDGIHQKCLRCGEFRLSGTAFEIIRKCDTSSRTRISGWVSDQNRNGTIPMITSDVVGQVSSRPLPTFGERADRLLLEALRGQNKLGDRFDTDEPRFIAATYSQDAGEVDFLLRMLLNQNLIMKVVAVGGICEIRPDGYIRLDKLTRRDVQSDKGFVAMSFDEELDSVYESGFQIGIMKAGYDPIRVDRLEHVNRIDDEIISQIRTASFIVADFTNHRGGVYFEAGYALGLGLPVIWTCRKDDMKDLHFDIRQYNTIDWEAHDRLALRLQHRIEATVGKGPKAVPDHP